MGKVEDGKPYQWGRLYAALRAVRGLASAGRVVPATDRELKDTVSRPRTVFRGFLQSSGLDVLAARERGGPVAAAAAVAFADVARLIPPQPMDGNQITPREQHFRQGYEAQLAEYRKAWEGLVD
ncbi:hypothetical protein GCM10010222_22110 [Streptomyces tanashiensis]|uniref:hypothetical protein n=1 Tax=Streptomyces tanashiensis TaxID=67367 RepID=UPI0016738FD8|nr:hypothetical protein [Streptomyces tanashiensis]GGS80402.1 hypothetical protein GCM10010222_22110 [Streptomyces tanashiensis]GGY19464.1 hypothetical protein GCM10010299_26110 [Streptomyces tanashiensis]